MGGDPPTPPGAACFPWVVFLVLTHITHYQHHTPHFKVITFSQITVDTTFPKLWHLLLGRKVLTKLDSILKSCSLLFTPHHGPQKWKQWQTLFSWAPKSLQMVTAAVKLKTLTAWKESYDQPGQHIKKQRHYFVNKGLSGQGYGFSSSHVWMLDYWTIEKVECQRIDAFEL